MQVRQALSWRTVLYVQAWGKKTQGKLCKYVQVWRLIRNERYDGDTGQAGAAESNKVRNRSKGLPWSLAYLFGAIGWTAAV